MLIFAISTKLHLTKKPSWIDPFRKKYGQMYEYHVTLKQPCFIDEGDVQKIKTALTDFFQTHEVFGHQIPLVFDNMVIEPESDGRMTVMVNAEESPAIRKLQKSILDLFPGEASYLNPESKEWEQNFKPHVTIAADLELNVYEDAKHDIGTDVRCEGYIDAVTLDLVRENDKDKKRVDQIEYRFLRA